MPKQTVKHRGEPAVRPLSQNFKLRQGPQKAQKDSPVPHPFAALSPFATLLTACLFWAFGIYLVACGRPAAWSIQLSAAILLAAEGIARCFYYCNRRHYIWAAVTVIGYLFLGASFYIFPGFYAGSFPLLFGLWFLLMGAMRALVCVQCFVQNLQGKTRNLLFGVLSLFFGTILITGSARPVDALIRIAGIYLIIYSATELIDFIVELLRWDKVGNRIKRRVRIPIPTFLAALLPVTLVNRFNAYFKEKPPEERAIFSVNAPEGMNRVDLEIFIHMAKGAIGRFGHVDIAYGDTVYSYGCYDHHSHKIGRLVSDGSFAVIRREPYVHYCLTHDKQLLISFGLCLTRRQKEAVENKLREIAGLLMEWKPDAQCKREGLPVLPPRKGYDEGSALYEATGAKLYKVKKGPFKTFFALNTNCVQLADTIAGATGIDDLRLNGISTPGAYYAMLNDLFAQKNSFVVSRTILKA